jgi:hypothetical protein
MYLVSGRTERDISIFSIQNQESIHLTFPHCEQESEICFGIQILGVFYHYGQENEIYLGIPSHDVFYRCCFCVPHEHRGSLRDQNRHRYAFRRKNELSYEGEIWSETGKQSGNESDDDEEGYGCETWKENDGDDGESYGYEKESDERNDQNPKYKCV